MRKFLVEVQFNGKKYFGFQKNTGKKTIQEELEKAVSNLMLNKINVDGCSRTDTGVSAKQYFFTFDADTKLPADRICYKLNKFLPKDIQCQCSREVDNNFNLRKNVLSKTYSYNLYCGEHIKPLINSNYLFVKGELNIERMQECSKLLMGTKNFKSFCNINNDSKTFVRTIKDIKIIKKEDNIIEIEITADGFLYNMMRILAGTLILCGKNQLNKDDIINLLESRNRGNNPAKTLVSKGLILKRVEINL